MVSVPKVLDIGLYFLESKNILNTKQTIFFNANTCLVFELF